MACVGHVACMGEMRKWYSNFGKKIWRKRQLGRNRRRWEDNIRMNLREIRCEAVDMIHVAQDRDE